VLPDVHAELDEFARAFGNLPAGPEAAPEVEMLRARLAMLLARSDAAHEALAAAVARLNGRNGDTASKRDLNALIGLQHWRPARFDVADDEINYRRFFAVSDLAAIRMELPEVFEEAHRLVFSLIEEGLIDGLRIDHVDGLFDPAGYCRKLREAVPRPIYLVVEKILTPGERLRANWRVDGTTGYEFATLVNRLLVDPGGLDTLDAMHRELGGEPFSQIEWASKYRIMQHELHAELDALSAGLAAFARTNIFTCDLTRRRIRHALQAYVAAMPRYRTYATTAGIDEEDREIVARTIAVARARVPELGAELWEFLTGVLTAGADADLSPERRDQAAALAMRVQQATGPVMAKGLEDTALFRDNRLIALNDVGARPDAPPASIAEFHAANTERAAHYPHSMLGTSSHDSKRGEDARARIAALSGVAPEWRATVARWHQALQLQGAPALHPADEYHFFQMLVGTWPAALGPEVGASELTDYCERLQAAMRKSVREGHLRSGWASPDEDYEARLKALIDVALGSTKENSFLAMFRDFERRTMRSGAFNGLIATMLKLTVPGVPDIYRGAEGWEQSMVDPDNRRALDFARLEQQLAGSDRSLETLARHWRDGAVKQALIARLLHLRRAEPDLFAAGSYEPIEAGGPDGKRICAFVRRHEAKALLVAVRLYPGRDGETIPVPELAFPVELPRDEWHDALASPVPAAPGPPAWAGPLPVLAATNFTLAE
jgi:(1->4)-alpha-D-glucan 1-alpha-D-glucosylmutase